MECLVFIYKVKNNLRAIFLKLIRVTKHCAKGEFVEIYNKISRIYSEERNSKKIQKIKEVKKIEIICTSHTLFVANLFCETLKIHQKESSLTLYDKNSNYEFKSADLYIIFCANLMKILPPGEKRVIFQLEQFTSKRWFTPKYFSILENSLAIIDFSSYNLELLSQKNINYPHTYFLPIGGFVNYKELLKLKYSSKKYEILFYGDVNSERRKILLHELKKHFDVKIVTNIFGYDMFKLIAESKLVININFYDKSVLPTARIYECLSLGTPVLSEACEDIKQFEDLDPAVVFFKSGNAEHMLKKAKQMLNKKSYKKVIEKTVLKSSINFNFYFSRFLFSLELISYKNFEQATSNYDLVGNSFCLSLPETAERRKYFNGLNLNECKIFGGLRYSPGWMGCAFSYKFLARKALENNLNFLEVMEDDLVITKEFFRRKKYINAWLINNSSKWDIFSGIIANVHEDLEVLDVVKINGSTLITINRFVSNVYNIYSKKALKTIGDWDPNISNPEVNTIDRFLQSRKEIKTVVALPFLVGHNEKLNSTLWGFKNSKYNDMISRSEKKLFELTENFETRS